MKRVLNKVLAIALMSVLLAAAGCDLFKKYEVEDFANAVKKVNRRIQSEDAGDGFVFTQKRSIDFEIPPAVQAILALSLSGETEQIKEILDNLVEVLDGEIEAKVAADKKGMIFVDSIGILDFSQYIDKNTGEIHNIVLLEDSEPAYSKQTMPLDDAAEMYDMTLETAVIMFDVKEGTEPVIDKIRDREFYIEYIPGSGETGTAGSLSDLGFEGIELNQIINIPSAKIIIKKDEFFSKEYSMTVDIMALLALVYAGEYADLLKSITEWKITFDVIETVVFTSDPITVPDHDYTGER